MLLQHEPLGGQNYKVHHLFLPFSEIEDRLEAVTELTNADSAIFVKFAEILSSLPDVEKALTTIIHGKVD